MRARVPGPLLPRKSRYAKVRPFSSNPQKKEELMGVYSFAPSHLVEVTSRHKGRSSGEGAGEDLHRGVWIGAGRVGTM